MGECWNPSEVFIQESITTMKSCWNESSVTVKARSRSVSGMLETGKWIFTVLSRSPVFLSVSVLLRRLRLLLADFPLDEDLVNVTGFFLDNGAAGRRGDVHHRIRRPEGLWGLGGSALSQSPSAWGQRKGRLVALERDAQRRSFKQGNCGERSQTVRKSTSQHIF